MALPQPPVFNLPPPPEPIFEIEELLSISKELLDIRSDKCKSISILSSSNINST